MLSCKLKVEFIDAPSTRPRWNPWKRGVKPNGCFSGVKLPANIAGPGVDPNVGVHLLESRRLVRVTILHNHGMRGIGDLRASCLEPEMQVPGRVEPWSMASASQALSLDMWLAKPLSGGAVTLYFERLDALEPLR